MLEKEQWNVQQYVSQNSFFFLKSAILSPLFSQIIIDTFAGNHR